MIPHLPRYAKAVGYLLVRETLADKIDDLPLAVSELGVVGPPSGHGSSVTSLTTWKHRSALPHGSSAATLPGEIDGPGRGGGHRPGPGERATRKTRSADGAAVPSPGHT